MVLHRTRDQWRGVVAFFGWGWGVNDFLLMAIALLLAQVAIVVVIATVGNRMGYYLHQSLCAVGAILWLPIVTLCIASVLELTQ